MSHATAQAIEALQAIRLRWDGRAKVGLILGTGLGGLAEAIEPQAIIAYDELPHFPCTTALGHHGALICGTIAGTTVLAMQGRCHPYEGHAPSSLALPVEVMRRAGVEILIVSNASGAVNPSYLAGEIMVIEDHINLMWASYGHRGLITKERCVRGKSCYDEILADLALQAARQHNIVARRGVYVAVTGPNYETRAEYRFFRRIGGDVVGMSTVPEVVAASQLGMRVLALSTVTNVAKPDAPQRTTAHEVVAVAAQAEPKLRQIVVSVLAHLQPPADPAREAVSISPPRSHAESYPF